MVEEDVESFLRVDHLGFERGGRAGFHACHFRREDFEDWLCCRWDVCTVSFGCGWDDVSNVNAAGGCHRDTYDASVLLEGQMASQNLTSQVLRVSAAVDHQWVEVLR